VDASSFQPGRRRQLSGPGLRTFLNIADEWQLSELERLRVLGFPARSTFHRWVAKVRQRTDITLSVDKLRISAVLGIYKVLKIVFSREEDAVCRPLVAGTEHWASVRRSSPPGANHLGDPGRPDAGAPLSRRLAARVTEAISAWPRFAGRRSNNLVPVAQYNPFENLGVQAEALSRHEQF
jgi:hypothetical protein